VLPCLSSKVGLILDVMNSEVYKSLSHLHPDLISEIREFSVVKEFPKDTQILREGQYVKVIASVLEGLIRVSTSHDAKELLLYYIKPDESCIMSFAASLKNEPSKVIAVVEEHTRVLLIPTDRFPKWLREYPEFNTLFHQLFNLRYSELLDTINHLFSTNWINDCMII
jgi:CRP/FNR family transcriptional regulator